MKDDHALAARLAQEAGELLLDLRKRLDDGADAAELRDQGDRQSHEMLMAALAEARPDDAVLSEEGADDLVRLDAERVWIIDPLDGTREFGEAGRTDWAVHVALWERGDLVVGAVGLPALHTVLSTGEPPRLGRASDEPPRVIVSRTRPPKVALEVAESLGGRLVEMGSAGAKAMAVVRGEADVYVHAGGQYEWDSAAPVAVARAAGLHTSRIDGTDLLYNNKDSSLPDLLICRPELADETLRALAG